MTTERQIRDRIEEWAGRGMPEPINEALGMTPEQYGEWSRTNVIPDGHSLPTRPEQEELRPSDLLPAMAAATSLVCIGVIGALVVLFLILHLFGVLP